MRPLALSYLGELEGLDRPTRGAVGRSCASRSGCAGVEPRAGAHGGTSSPCVDMLMLGSSSLICMNVRRTLRLLSTVGVGKVKMCVQFETVSYWRGRVH